MAQINFTKDADLLDALSAAGELGWEGLKGLGGLVGAGAKKVYGLGKGLYRKGVKELSKPFIIKTKFEESLKESVSKKLQQLLEEIQRAEKAKLITPKQREQILKALKAHEIGRLMQEKPVEAFKAIEKVREPFLKAKKRELSESIKQKSLTLKELFKRSWPKTVGIYSEAEKAIGKGIESSLSALLGSSLAAKAGLQPYEVYKRRLRSYLARHPKLMSILESIGGTPERRFVLTGSAIGMLGAALLLRRMLGKKRKKKRG